MQNVSGLRLSQSQGQSLPQPQPQPQPHRATRTLPDANNEVVSHNSFKRHAKEIFQNALVARKDGFQTSDSRTQIRLDKVEEVLAARLLPRGAARQLSAPGGERITVYETGFTGVFLHSGRNKFSLSDMQGQHSTDILSRADIEKKILIDSHIAADPSYTGISSNAVLRVSDLSNHPGTTRTGTENALVCLGSTELDSPETIKKRCWQTLKDAQEAGLHSVTFKFGRISPRVSAPNGSYPPSRPTLADLALASATAGRYQENHCVKPVSVFFQFDLAEDRLLIDNLINQRATFMEEDVFQALLRGHIKEPTRPGNNADLDKKNRMATFVPTAIEVDPANRDRLKITRPRPLTCVLNGVSFGSGVTVPSFIPRAPAFTDEPIGGVTAAGAVIVEPHPDGRVWVVKPTNKFLELEFTFPKGQMGQERDPKKTAVKEAREESGLEVELFAHLTDWTGHRGKKTRYYLAQRIGGTPVNVEWESQAVCLIPQRSLLERFQGVNSQRDYFVASALLARSGLR